MNTKTFTRKAMMLPVVAALFSAGLYSIPAHAGFIYNKTIAKSTATNSDNRRYLTAKAERAGHHLGHVMAALSEPPESVKNGAPLPF